MQIPEIQGVRLLWLPEPAMQCPHGSCSPIPLSTEHALCRMESSEGADVPCACMLTTGEIPRAVILKVSVQNLNSEMFSGQNAALLVTITRF